MKLQESILQIIDVGGTDISGNAKPQATKITGGPYWLRHEITEDAATDALETSVRGALEQIAKGKTYDEWVKSTSMSPEVKAEVRRRLDAEDDSMDDEESHAGEKHQKDHITKAIYDSLPPEEQEKHQNNLKSAMKSYGMHDEEEPEEEPEEEQPQEQPQEQPPPEQANGNGLDYEIENEKKVKKEPKIKLSNKKEKVSINPKMESKEMKRKSLINELRQKHLQEKAPPGREDQVKALKSKVGKDSAYAIAWAQHNKHGKPSKEEVVSKEVRKVDFVDGITEELTNKDGHTFVITHRDIKGKSQDKVRMHVQDKSGKKIKDWGSHVSLDQARKFAKSRGFNEMSGDMAYRAMDKAEKKSRGELSVTDPAKAKRKARQAQKFADYSIKKTLNKEEVNEVVRRGWKKGTYHVKDADGKIHGTYKSGSHASKAMHKLMDKGVHKELEVTRAMDEDKGPCWPGYKQVGMKKKNGKSVPNCVSVNEKYDEMKNVVQSRMSPLEIVKALKDKVDSVNPTEMRGSSWSDYDQGIQELEKMVQPGRNVLMYRIRDLDTGDSGEIENFVFVMVDKIPKYKEMGYQVVAD